MLLYFIMHEDSWRMSLPTVPIPKCLTQHFSNSMVKKKNCNKFWRYWLCTLSFPPTTAAAEALKCLSKYHDLLAYLCIIFLLLHRWVVISALPISWDICSLHIFAVYNTSIHSLPSKLEGSLLFSMKVAMMQHCGDLEIYTRSNSLLYLLI